PEIPKQNYKRRQFLKKTGLGIAGLAALPTASSGNSLRLKAKSQTVALAIATITCDGFGDQNFEKAFEIIPQLPFKNVEFNCWYPRKNPPYRHQGHRKEGALAGQFLEDPDPEIRKLALT
ncbi:MAG: twin-arginine translocation signal domain-containing protein, partial [Cyclobacteriaceae bacterium]